MPSHPGLYVQLWGFALLGVLLMSAWSMIQRKGLSRFWLIGVFLLAPMIYVIWALTPRGRGGARSSFPEWPGLLVGVLMIVGILVRHNILPHDRVRYVFPDCSSQAAANAVSGIWGDSGSAGNGTSKVLSVQDAEESWRGPNGMSCVANVELSDRTRAHVGFRYDIEQGQMFFRAQRLDVAATPRAGNNFPQWQP